MRIKRRYIVLLLLVALVVVFAQPLETNAKVFLLLSQEFSQIPVKPLHLLTRAPEHRRFLLTSPSGSVVADLYLPRPWLGSPGRRSTPAIILAFGVKVPRSAHSQVLGFADSLARLGYAVLWPRLRALDEGQSRIEEPNTFVAAFTYLETVPAVNPRRISFVGISVGSSVAFVAAAEPRIARQVRSVVFFGGYFDLFDYLVSLATRHDRFEGHEVAWSPSPDAVSQVKAILRTEGAPSLLRIFRSRSSGLARRLLAAANPRQIAGLRRFSPSDHLRGFSAHIFILHSTNDRYVPYVESEKLYRALPRQIHKAILLTAVFQHVEPGGGGVQQLLQLYGFVYQAFSYL